MRVSKDKACRKQKDKLFIQGQGRKTNVKHLKHYDSVENTNDSKHRTGICLRTSS